MEFVQVASVLEAMLEVSKFRPDLLVTDLELPEINGFQMLKALKSNSALARMQVLVVTDMDAAEIAHQGGLPEGAITHGKPLAMDWLHGYVSALAALRQRQH